ncbi:MAG: DUF262 domain-containing protein [Sphingopyxis granuli]|uniref:GmrSD restriction endonuclease domain-containing protein n=1 Tax=Sphingopyxis granuli TaxID=267128 RepID=UPI003C749306
MASTAPDLTVRGEAVERVYGNFNERRFVVNRRYQRKLIWTIAEKQEFIDSIIQGFPVPLILLAESANREGNDLEIIDGMQRLDAVVSFIENRYPVHGMYFDLETMAVTKELLDSGKIQQQQPKMDRKVCVDIASYLVPLSIYEFADEQAVDTVFRRINSGGRQLSRQELRSAGATGHFATVVRKLAAKVRGDDSFSDILRLNEMQNISITNKDLSYGIDVDNLFWVSNGILSRDNVRKSQDEELIADIVSYMVYDDPVSSRTEFLDDYYQEKDGDDTSAKRHGEIENFVQKRSEDLIVIDFIRVLDQIKIVLAKSGESFNHLFFSDKQDNPVPRYFQTVFLALYDLIVVQGLQIGDRDAFIDGVRNSADHINVQGGGGRWGADNRMKAIEAATGMYQKFFVLATEMDPAKILWITQLQNLLSQSYTEQSAYDFKQGFFNLAHTPAFDEESFEKILKTLVSIANLGRDRVGYVLVGVAENAETAARVEDIFKVKSLPYESFWITGVDHECAALGKNPDQLFQYIVDRVRHSNISEPLRSYIASNIKPVRYFDKTVYVFETKGMPEPSLYENDYYARVGAQIEKLKPADFPQLFKRYGA